MLEFRQHVSTCETYRSAIIDAVGELPVAAPSWHILAHLNEDGSDAQHPLATLVTSTAGPTVTIETGAHPGKIHVAVSAIFIRRLAGLGIVELQTKADEFTVAIEPATAYPRSHHHVSTSPERTIHGR